MQDVVHRNRSNRSDVRINTLDSLGESIWSFDSIGLWQQITKNNHACIVIDLNKTGLSISSTESILIGQHITVQLLYKQFSPISVRGRIRYCHELPVSDDLKFNTVGDESIKLFQIGMYFEGNKSKVHDQLNLLVANIDTQ